MIIRVSWMFGTNFNPIQWGKKSKFMRCRITKTKMFTFSSDSKYQNLKRISIFGVLL